MNIEKKRQLVVQDISQEEQISFISAKEEYKRDQSFSIQIYISCLIKELIFANSLFQFHSNLFVASLMLL
jgi:hypothetical protein